MISLLTGKVAGKANGEIVLMTAGGVGYRVAISPNAYLLAAVGEEAKIETYLVVKDNALELFGFASPAERALFKNFLNVSGVGPKTALHLLSLGSVEEITVAIGRGDTDYLTRVSGIGKRTAERLVVELKSKVVKDLREDGVSLPPMNDAVSDVLDGLITLGYSVLQAREAVKKLNPEGKTSEQLLREALRAIK